MCGICGLVDFDAGVAAAAPERPIDAGIASLRHRGPDAQGSYTDGQVSLGHTRLSILDLSDSAAQPMATPDGRHVLTYNGEVYNFRELAAELSLTNLRSRSDTEVVLQAFTRLGVQSCAMLNGIFAFALYDRARQKLWLVRDRLGVKPLYYSLDAQGLAFASEIKAILAMRRRTPVCDLSHLSEWLQYGATLGGRTLHQGISQLLPGHFLELDLASRAVRIEAYWSIEDALVTDGPATGSTAALIADTRRLLDEAVRRQLVSDVPVGVFLSGGVDSSAIAAFASKHYTGRLATYSAGFDDADDVDERPKARMVAAHFGTDHHELQITGSAVTDLVERMVFHHDQPFADAANIPLYLMAAKISAQTKVVLQGDGGDELFGGYRRYSTLRFYPWLRALAGLGRGVTRLAPDSSRRQRVQRYVDAFGAGDPGSTMALLLSTEEAGFHPAAAFLPEYQHRIEQTDPFAHYRDTQRRFSGRDLGSQMSLVDMTVVLPDLYLEKVDRATMAASLEVRVPFLDNELVRFVSRIPSARKTPWGRKKWLLKQALTGIVPQEILYGPKTGFNVPFGYWLRTSHRPLFFDHLETFTRERPGVLDRNVLQTWYDDTTSGRRDRSFMLWKMLNFMIWCNNAKVQVAV